MRISTSIGTVAVILINVVIARGADALVEGFKNPPDEARPHTWWHWMNGNVTREGITQDLEAMKRVGLGFLKGGCSKWPLDLLKDAGVDMTTPAPVDAAMKRFEQLVDELDELV